MDQYDALEPIRLLVADVDTNNQLLTDQQYFTLYNLNGGDIRLTAADALDAIGTSELLVSKVIRSKDLQTDGAKVSAELRARADLLRQQVADADTDSIWDIVPATDGRRRPELTEPEVWGL